jgi:hypothetical protein
MTAVKHTPGPWWYAADAPDTYAVGAGDIEIAGGLRRANARLIAAAPELADIVRELTLATDEGDDVAQGTHYVRDGKIHCKGSFLELIERARRVLADAGAA